MSSFHSRVFNKPPLKNLPLFWKIRINLTYRLLSSVPKYFFPCFCHSTDEEQTARTDLIYLIDRMRSDRIISAKTTKRWASSAFYKRKTPLNVSCLFFLSGALISFYIAAIPLGQAFMCSVGIYVTYFQLNLIALVISTVAFFCILATAVESPSWKLMKQKESEAESCFNYYWNTRNADRTEVCSNPFKICIMRRAHFEWSNVSKLHSSFRRKRNV